LKFGVGVVAGVGWQGKGFDYDAIKKLSYF